MMTRDAAAPSRSAHGWKLAVPEALVLSAVAALCVVQLFLPPIVGMADNGDFNRVVEPLGLRPAVEAWADQYFSHVNVDYVSVPREPLLVVSSELVIAQLAQWLWSPLARDGSFHLGALAAVHLFFYLLGLYLILRSTQTLRTAPRATLALLVLLAAPDVAYVAMFNSFYTESPSLIFLVLLIGITLSRILRGTSVRITLPAFFAASAMFIAAKPQNFLLAVPLAAMAVGVVGNSRGRRIGGLTVAIGLLVLMAGLQLHLPHRFRSPVLWDTVFFSVLGVSPQPVEDLQAFGLDTSLVRYQGIPAWAGDLSTPHIEVTKDLGFLRIARFYMTHPVRTLQVARRCASQAFQWHDPLIGNYTKASGKPFRSLAPTLTGWSDMERRLFPGSLWFLILFFAAFMAMALWEKRQAGRGVTGEALAGLCLGLATMAILQFAVVAAFSGMKDVIKHLYLFQVLFDTCLAAALAWGATRLAQLMPWGSSRQLAENPEHAANDQVGTRSLDAP